MLNLGRIIVTTAKRAVYSLETEEAKSRYRSGPMNLLVNSMSVIKQI